MSGRPTAAAGTAAEACAEELRERLLDLGVVDRAAAVSLSALDGGVSSDIWRADLADGRRLCVKRALPRLKVAQLWEAPVERNRYEWEWFRTVGSLLPTSVPRLVAQDAEAGLFVMEYLEPDRYPVWKRLLRDGAADAAFAAAVGDRLARIHNATADRPDVAARFATDAGFHAIRLEPYLIATARAHPDRGAALEAIARETAATKRTLVHGDISPKNILVGPDGPVFLDAECAWYGDPAFDLAFCLNHLLLKCLWTPAAAAGFLACFDAMSGAYLDGVGWEPRAAIDGRAARLLPGLFLARVDGKSPVEYLTEEADKDRVRRVARRFLAEPPAALAAIRTAWAMETGL